MNNEDEDLLAKSATLLARRGEVQAAALLIDVTGIEFEVTDSHYETDETNLNYTRYDECAVFDVEDYLVDRFRPDITEQITSTIAYVAERERKITVTSIRVRPALPDIDVNWRESLLEQVIANQPNNQARRERGLAKYPVADDLTFGSKEELRVYRALTSMQQQTSEHNTFAVLPSPGARLRSGSTKTPDFVVIGWGKALVIEVDGPHHRNPLRRVDDTNRDLSWSRCGIHTERIAVEDTTDDATLVVRLKETLRRYLIDG